MGLRAAAGDVRAARFYYYWKVACVVIAVFSASLGSLVLGAYYAVVVRSHYIHCKEAEAAQIVPDPTGSVEAGQCFMRLSPPTTAAPPSYDAYVAGSAGNIQG